MSRFNLKNSENIHRQIVTAARVSRNPHGITRRNPHNGKKQNYFTCCQKATTDRVLPPARTAPNRLLRVIDAGNSIAMGIQYLSLQFDHYDN